MANERELAGHSRNFFIVLGSIVKWLSILSRFDSSSSASFS
jgi:hypothetical protein